MQRLILGALVLVASSVQAQSIPSITKTKQAATNAVAAANAQTQASSMLPADTGTAKAPAPPAGGKVATDSAAGATSLVSAGAAFERETFMYDRGGRRDPFVSLMSIGGDLRPLLSDLRLVAVAFDPTGHNSVAVLHDLSTKDKAQYRVRVGQSLGRMRVSSISPKAVVFTIEEFGYSRQETLALGDSNTERKQ